MSRTGVSRPDAVDLIAFNPHDEECVLIISQTASWTGTKRELELLRDKINGYISFALGGQLREKYPQHAAHPVVIQLDHGEALPPGIAGFTKMVSERIQEHGLRFRTRDLSE